MKTKKKHKKLIRIMVIAAVALAAAFVFWMVKNYDIFSMKFYFERNWNTDLIPGDGKIIYSADADDVGIFMDYAYTIIQYGGSYELSDVSNPKDNPGFTHKYHISGSVSDDIREKCDEMLGELKVSDEIFPEYDNIDVCYEIERSDKQYSRCYMFALQDSETKTLYVFQDFNYIR